MEVISGIPQGTILGLLLFLIYINDLPEICTDEAGVYLFADDAKIYKFITSASDHVLLQKNFCALESWSDKWLLKLNAKKCKVISFSRSKNNINKYNYSITASQTPSILEREEYITDLGVVMDEELKFTKAKKKMLWFLLHCQKKLG